MSNIYLVGMMGVGKTTIGKKLATFIGVPFIDTDHELEKRNGVSVAHIFDIEGEEGFRLRETRLLTELSENFDGVVATGGGVITQSVNAELLKASGRVIYLKANIGTLWSRLRYCNNRPLLKTSNPKQQVVTLLKAREPLYEAAADIIIPVGKGSAFKMAKHIHSLINENTPN